MIRVILFLYLWPLSFCIVAQDFGTGHQLNDLEYKLAPLKKRQVEDQYKNLPPVVSLKEYCPRPGNQFNLETSSSWAVAYSAMTIVKAKKEGWKDIKQISSNTFSAIYNYALAQVVTDIDCEKPLSLYKSLRTLQDEGSPLFTDFMQFCPPNVPDEVKEKVSDFKVSFSKLYELDEDPHLKISQIKKSISEGNPVVVGMEFTPTFFTAKEFWKPRTTGAQKKYQHAVCIIGYDDKKYGIGAIEILNSWGSSWGNSGYMWIPYPDFSEVFNYAYEVFPAKNNLPTLFKAELVSKIHGIVDLKKVGPGYYQTKRSYGEGSIFDLGIQSEGNAFVYMLSTDLDQEYFRHFPTNDFSPYNFSPAITHKNNKLIISNELDHFELDDKAGKDFLIVLVSDEPIEFDGFMQSINLKDGLPGDRLKNIFGYKEYNSSKLKWSDHQPAFSHNSAIKGVVSIIIEIQHH
jgi:hypothetical protein